MTDQLLESLKRADPVDSDELHARPLPRDRLMAIMATERAQRATTAPVRLRPRRLLPIAAAAAMVIAGLVAVLPSTSDKASPEVVSALESVAGIAAAQAHVGPVPGLAYVKLATVEGAMFADPGGGFTYHMPVTIEQWTAPDGSGRVREVHGAPEFPGARDERRWRLSGLPALPTPHTSDQTFEPGKLNSTTPGAEGLAPTRDLPTDPDELADVLRDTAADSDQVPIDVKTFEIAASLLMQAGASAELRAALYEVVADIDGVDSARKTRDPLGRLGTAVSIDSDYTGARTRETLIFDPTTSQPLAHLSTLLEPQPWIDSRQLRYTVVKSSGRVDDTQTRP